MLITISGTYEQGRIVLDEVPNAKDNSKVVVTFLEETQSILQVNRRLGSLKGKISIPIDFNEPIDDLKEYMF